MAPAPMAGMRRAAVLVAALALLGTGIAPAHADETADLTAPPLVDATSADSTVDDSSAIPEGLRAKVAADSPLAFLESSPTPGGAGLRAAQATTTEANGTASISGVLTYWSAGVGGYPLSTGAIDAHRYDAGIDDYEFVATATTAANGAYTLSGLPAGEYLLLAYDTAATPKGLPEFYRDAQVVAWAEHVIVADGQARTGINEELEPLLKDRIAGADRYATSVAASQSAFDEGVACVWIANGLAFPDALSAGPAAAHCGGPLLLVPGTGIPTVVLDELKRLKPAKIYVAGGTGAVSANVEKTLRTLAPSFQRYAGTDRYDTSRKIVAGAFGTSDAVWVASGLNFPDALSASGAAAAADIPVLILPGTATSLDAASRTAITNLGAASVGIAGGTGAVSKGIESGIWSIASVEWLERFGGATRYATADAIATAVWDGSWAIYAFLASGSNFPDALAAAPLAGWVGAPLFITPDTCTTAETRGLIDYLGVYEAFVMGYYQPLYYGNWQPFRAC
ncbi:N-acetylmuramoyl-L-alanine amidase LytC [Agromyces sp. NDB4Y10]|uniref:cell wall-binding repeat-containing protein n=1 Tax=Agromyces sp. NDB4Y10 TaxID=1775951 RepID=UPI0007B1C1B2|nr:cell wall-binding repeat-containing protein [Agromyces sp. NDB4Y10]KZE93316.1 N-acetylmuramoyl-L-alanine amidase LytC [Agromyces sp. NDB4Y10]